MNEPAKYPKLKKFRVTIKIFGNVIPADFNFVSAEIVVWESTPERAEDYARAFLTPYGINVYADIDEVTELAS